MNPNDLILASSNWDEFFRSLSALEKINDKGDVFERFTQLYLQAAPKYPRLLKKVWKLDIYFDAISLPTMGKLGPSNPSLDQRV